MAGSAPPTGWRDGFGHLLRSEWTKLWTVRGWVVGLGVAAGLTVLLGLPPASGSSGGGCADRPEGDPACTAPIGPTGDRVSDTFFFVHQPLDGDGSITVRLTSLAGMQPSGDGPIGGGDGGGAEPGPAGMEPGLVPWAKAGIIVKDGTDQGSTYAALMATGDHGVRMQHDFVHDTAGPESAVTDRSPRWLRLTRSGDTVTGETSVDGSTWTTVGTARLDGLADTAEAGLFVASPEHTDAEQRPFELGLSTGPSQATGVFDEISLQGEWPDGAWTGETIGDGSPLTSWLGGYEASQSQSGDTLTISGTGDIAPAVADTSRSIGQSLVGTFVGMIAVVVVAALFVTTEYRQGLVLTTLAANPRRGRVLAAKAIVIAAATFLVGLVATFVTVRISQAVRSANGDDLVSVDALTELRVVAGTAALLAVGALLALAVGTVLRRGGAAVVAVVAAIVVPYVLATASVLPAGPSDWLLRLTPAAGFSIQQTLAEHPQVSSIYTPANGYYPLGPWQGFAVLCAYTLLALVLARFVLHRRDA